MVTVNGNVKFTASGQLNYVQAFPVTHRYQWKPPYHDSDQVRIERCGNVVTVNGNVKFTASGQLNYVQASETIPVGYRPTGVNSPIVCGNVDFSMLVDQNGTVTMLGNPESAYTSMHGAWITNDPMPD